MRLEQFHVFNRKFKHKDNVKLPRLTLLEAVQNSMSVVDQLSQMNPGDREAMRSVLGKKKGIIDLESLTKNSKMILKKAGISLEGKIIEMVKSVFIYMMPFLVTIIIFVLFYKAICCVIHRKRRKNQKPIEQIIIRERASDENVLEQESML